MLPFSPLRAGLILLAIVAGLTLPVSRVAYLQTYGRQQAIRQTEDQHYVTRPIIAGRGTIADRNGLLLASTLQSRALYVDPKFLLQEYQRGRRNLNQMDQDLARLCKLLEVNVDDLLNLLAQRSESRYEKVAEDISEQLAGEIEKLKIPGVGLEPMPKRFYPMGAVASHILGTVGSENQGLEGVERQFQELLGGKNGIRRVRKDARGHAIAVEADDYVPPIHGRHLVLTIDATIQMLAEEELSAVCQKFQAKCGEVVVMDPRTGEVLALANYPTYNPQIPGESRAEDRLNRAIVVPYEPGSTAKPFVAGPALDQNITHLTEMWKIPGITYTPYGSRHIRDVHHYGPLCTWDVLVKSSNIGMSMLAERMGNPRLFAALTSFGFGQRTGIELPGEDPGLVRPLNKWNHFSTESVAQGYEMMVTPLQLARGFCVYANGGKLIQPTLIRGTLDEQGNLMVRQRRDLAECPQVIAPRASAQVRHVLSDVVIRGTAQGKGSKYWNIFGKTGTSHISQGRAGYAQNRYNSSFMAGAPLEDPRIVVAMIIHEPDKSLGHYGGTVSAPPSVRLIERTLGYLQVPTSPKLQPPPADIASKLHNFNAKMYEQTGLTE